MKIITTKHTNTAQSIQSSKFVSLFKIVGMLLLGLLFSVPVFAQTTHDTTSYIQTVDVQTGKIDTILVAKGDY